MANTTIKPVACVGMLTNELITCHRDAHDLLEAVADQLPSRPFLAHWKDKDGYYDDMVHLQLNLGDGFTCRDPLGRLMVVLPGKRGNMIYFDRHGGRSGPVCCNGHMQDLAPSWDSKVSFTGYVADTDQLCEPLLRLVGAI